MFKSRRDLDYLNDVHDAIKRALDYTDGMIWEEYLRDPKTQDAVVRNLEVIGEATKVLSEQIREQYPGIPWREMMGTRDRLIHHYFGINQEIVWQIVQYDLPELKIQVERLIEEFPTEE